MGSEVLEAVPMQEEYVEVITGIDLKSGTFTKSFHENMESALEKFLGKIQSAFVTALDNSKKTVQINTSELIAVGQDYDGELKPIQQLKHGTPVY